MKKIKYFILYNLTEILTIIASFTTQLTFVIVYYKLNIPKNIIVSVIYILILTYVICHSWYKICERRD